MKNSNKKLADLEDSSLVRVCLNGMLPSDDSLEECRARLEVSPPYLSYAICHDPMFGLLGEKNIFSLVNNFFTKFAIEKIGCEAATQLIFLPLEKIQSIACGVVSAEKNLTSTLLDSIGLESMDAGCSLSILPKTSGGLQSCYPSYDFNISLEEKFENIISTEIICLENLKGIAIGERIKLCDDFEKAMECSTCDPYEAARNYLQTFYPERKITSQDVETYLTRYRYPITMPRYPIVLRGLNSNDPMARKRESAEKFFLAEY